MTPKPEPQTEWERRLAVLATRRSKSKPAKPRPPKKKVAQFVEKTVVSGTRLKESLGEIVLRLLK